MEHIIHIDGIRHNHSSFGGYLHGKVSFTTRVSDYKYNTLEKDKVAYNLGRMIVFDDGDYKAGMISVKIKEWRDATEYEVKKYYEILKSNNIEFKYFEDVKYEFPCWIEKGKMPIMLNGTLTNVDEFKKMQFDEDEKALLSYDNGYSHWSTDTTDFKRVYEIIDKQFADEGNTFCRGRVHTGSLMGWRFGEKGELVITTTKKEIHTSIVTNS